MTEDQASYEDDGKTTYWCAACGKRHMLDQHKRALATVAATIATVMMNTLHEHDGAMNSFGDQLAVLTAAFGSGVGQMLGDESESEARRIIDDLVRRLTSTIVASAAIHRRTAEFEAPGPGGTDGSA